ncbi:dual OB domain-containing protein [Desulfurispora thermophila]|uniref:dual OB domain-containing protein n=1 Tax=Desulfurispora thermophila TaxID=265470 RepID=UPI0003737F63|nr:hypothetical protein [Desulfurispora thermophila]
MEDFVAFVCLANSRKNHDRCVAGIDLETGNWVRLVRDRRGSALQYRQVCYIEGEELEPLDIAAVMIAHKAPLYFQPENVVIDNTCSMFWHGKMPVDKLDNYCTKETYLWGDNSDRIPAADLEQYAGRPGYPGSLQLSKRDFLSIKKFFSC